MINHQELIIPAFYSHSVAMQRHFQQIQEDPESICIFRFKKRMNLTFADEQSVSFIVTEFLKVYGMNSFS